MASAPKISYQRLQNEYIFDEISFGRPKPLSRLRKVQIRRRLKVKIPSLKKFLRRKAKLVAVYCSRVLKRLKESQNHFGDLFAGNYLFMQVTPTPMKCVDKSFMDFYVHRAAIDKSFKDFYVHKASIKTTV